MTVPDAVGGPGRRLGQTLEITGSELFGLPSSGVDALRVVAETFA